MRINGGIMISSRELALHILMDIEKNEAFSNILLNNKLLSSNLSSNDKRLTTQIVYGVIANKITIDHIIKKCSKIKFNKISLPILTILRTGIFQLYYLDKIPASAVCNEGVKLAKKYGHVSSANFVNAILRNVSRTEKKEFFKGVNNKKTWLSLFYSYPEWMVNLWIKQYGEDETEKLLKANIKTLYDCVRVNTLLTTREKMISRFKNSKPGKLPDIIYVENILEVLSSDEFNNGLVTVQDEAPSLVSHLLDAKETDNILDICAAPGGKTTHVATLTNNKANILAMDLYENRCKLIYDTAKRLKITSITVKANDAREFNPELENKFDRIIADVPCSGLGVIRKKPDIKFNIKEEDIANINKIQKDILKNVARYLKVGGRLVYSTCTNVFLENQETVKWFLKEYPNFKIDTDTNLIPNEWKDSLNEGMLSLLPSKNGCDGFFIVSLTKTE